MTGRDSRDGLLYRVRGVGRICRMGEVSVPAGPADPAEIEW